MKLRRRHALIALLVFLTLASVAKIWLGWHGEANPRSSGTASSTPPAFPELAFRESYLDSVAGKYPERRADCLSCHPTPEGLPPRRWEFFRRRSELSRDTWAGASQLQARCGVCHLVPDPSTLPQPSWSEVMERMQVIMEARRVTTLTPEEQGDIRHFYYAFSPEFQRPLSADRDPAESPLLFEPDTLGSPISADLRDRPILGQVTIADADRDGRPDVLVCDIEHSAVNWVHRTNSVWREDTLARVTHPARAQLVTAGPGRAPNIVVASLGTTRPIDDPVGSVVLLVNDGAMHFTPMTILDGISRVADVEPADFDGDGDVDFVVAAYGFINQGEVGWLENEPNGSYVYHLILKKTGAINVLPADLNGDGRPDFVALFGQEHEEISAFINDGRGGFQEHVIFKAATPSFGSSGIQLVDLDQDGDLDILYTNGDNLDLPTVIPRPYHGVQWLENQGNLSFVWHDIHRFYGAYCAVAGDLNGDGKLDIVVTSMFNDWLDPNRASILWLENDGWQRFDPHTIAREPIHLISAALGDMDGDGRIDIVASGMNMFAPFDRMGRLTLWKNLGARPVSATSRAANRRK